MSTKDKLNKIKDERLGTQLTGEKATSLGMGESKDKDAIAKICEEHGLGVSLLVGKNYDNPLSSGYIYEEHNEIAKNMVKNLLNTNEAVLKNNIQRGVGNMMNFIKDTQKD